MQLSPVAQEEGEEEVVRVPLAGEHPSRRRLNSLLGWPSRR